MAQLLWQPWAARGVFVAAGLGLSVACSLITSYDGFVRDGGSPMDAPDDAPPQDGPTGTARLIGSMSTMIATKIHPTFAVETKASVVEVELCRDRACAMPIGRFELKQPRDGGFEGAPTNLALSAGDTLFWRARVYGQVATTVWELRLPQKEGAADTAWGSTFDVDGDGLADLAVAAPSTNASAGLVYVYPGSALAADASTSPWSPAFANQSTKFGSRMAAAGDVDGDGLADLAVGEADYMGDVGRAHFFRGTTSGLGTQLSIVGPGGATLFGSSVAGAGDVNGDGYGDVVVGAALNAGGMGSVRVFFGAADFFNPAATPKTMEIVGSTANAGFGDRAAGPCDVDGDRLGDIVVSAPGSGSVFVYYGSASGSFGAPSRAVGLPDIGSLACADVDGDGLADVIVGSPAAGPGSVSVFRGGARPPMLSLLATVNGTDGTGARFGSAVAPVYALSTNGGFQFLVGAPDAGGTSVGRAHLAYADPDGGVIVGPPINAPAGGQFGGGVAGIGRIAIGAPNANAVYVYAPPQFGAPAQTIMAPSAVKFGASIAP